MLKKISKVAVAMLFCSGAFGQKIDSQIAQKAQLMQYIQREETVLKTESDSFETLSALVKETKRG